LAEKPETPAGRRAETYVALKCSPEYKAALERLAREHGYGSVSCLLDAAILAEAGRHAFAMPPRAWPVGANRHTMREEG
jgi:hypothetical protein